MSVPPAVDPTEKLYVPGATLDATFNVNSDRAGPLGVTLTGFGVKLERLTPAGNPVAWSVTDPPNPASDSTQTAYWTVPFP